MDFMRPAPPLFMNNVQPLQPMGPPMGHVTSAPPPPPPPASHPNIKQEQFTTFESYPVTMAPQVNPMRPVISLPETADSLRPTMTLADQTLPSYQASLDSAAAQNNMQSAHRSLGMLEIFAGQKAPRRVRPSCEAVGRLKD